MRTEIKKLEEEKKRQKYDYYAALGVYTEKQEEVERLLRKRNLYLSEVKRHLEATVVFDSYGVRPIKVDFEGLKRAVEKAESCQKELEALMAEANKAAEVCERPKLALEERPFLWTED